MQLQYQSDLRSARNTCAEHDTPAATEKAPATSIDSLTLGPGLVTQYLLPGQREVLMDCLLGQFDGRFRSLHVIKSLNNVANY